MPEFVHYILSSHHLGFLLSALFFLWGIWDLDAGSEFSEPDNMKMWSTEDAAPYRRRMIRGYIFSFLGLLGFLLFTS